MHQFFQSEVVNIINESPRVKRFFFKVEAAASFNFIAGQFVILSLPIDDKEEITRSYSIASAPSKDNIYELCIALKEDGIATNWIWKHVEIGTKLQSTGPFGKFVLPELIDSDLFMICTGTGVAPFRSMILDIYHNNIPHQNIYLIFGNRVKADILYNDEFIQLAATYPEFNYMPVLSRETLESWNGYTGYVHPIYMGLIGENRKAMFYLCGWNTMVKEAKDHLKAAGFSRKEIKFELYD